jgi:hypothetical protein
MAACPPRASPTDFSIVTSIRIGLLLLTVVSSVGCRGRLSAVRNPSHRSLAGHIVYRHYEAPRRADDGASSGGGIPLAVALDVSQPIVAAAREHLRARELNPDWIEELRRWNLLGVAVTFVAVRLLKRAVNDSFRFGAPGLVMVATVLPNEGGALGPNAPNP